MYKRLCTLLLIAAFYFSAAAQPQFILDADTGNEMDDYYAIARALAPDGLNLIALQSAHFNNLQLITESDWYGAPTDSIPTVEISHRLNEKLAGESGNWMLPLLKGCDRMLGYAWGFHSGAPIPESPATRFIIDKARKASPSNKLNVICIGASTNVATAIATAPEIAANLRVYLLGARYDARKKAWNKSEFNIRNDLNAFDLLLNAANLELWVMPVNVAQSLTFQKSNAFNELAQCQTPLCKSLRERWFEVSAEDSWIMWDLALVEALIHPDLTVSKSVMTPPENNRRKIKVYTSIDAKAMEAAFWKSLLSWQGN